MVEPSTNLQFAECCFSNYKQAIDIRSAYYIYAKVAQFCNVCNNVCSRILIPHIHIYKIYIIHLNCIRDVKSIKILTFIDAA